MLWPSPFANRIPRTSHDQRTILPHPGWITAGSRHGLGTRGAARLELGYRQNLSASSVLERG